MLDRNLLIKEGKGTERHFEKRGSTDVVRGIDWPAQKIALSVAGSMEHCRLL